jgi:hypothetical protein
MPPDAGTIGPDSAVLDAAGLPTTDAAALAPLNCAQASFLTRVFCDDFDDHPTGETKPMSFGSAGAVETSSTNVSAPNSGEVTLPAGDTSGGMIFSTIASSFTLDFDWKNDLSLVPGTQIANITSSGRTVLLTVLADGGLEVSDNGTLTDRPAPLGWIHVRVTQTEVDVDGVPTTIIQGTSAGGVTVKLGVMQSASQVMPLVTHFDDVIMTTPLVN